MANLSRSRPRVCVLDPVLVLSPYGIQLVRQLGTVLQLWIAREFWAFARQQPFWLTLDCASASLPPETVRAGAQAWQTLQNHTSPAELSLYWYGDRLWESHVPPPHSAAGFDHWEALAERLETGLPMTGWAAPLWRDTLALTIALPGSFVLTVQDDPDQPPGFCQFIDTAQISCQRLTEQDALVQRQSQVLQACLLQTGLMALQWSKLRLAVVQLAVCDQVAVPALLTNRYRASSGIDRSRFENITGSEFSLDTIWQDNQASWYSL